MNGKVYWSSQGNDKWERGTFLTMFLIPNEWWSIKAWKLAFSMRNEMLKKYLEALKGREA